MKQEQALNALLALPGGLFDEGQQLGVRIRFKANGDLGALRLAIASAHHLMGTQLSERHSSVTSDASEEERSETLTTLLALQARPAIELLVAHGFEIEDVAANMIPPKHYSLILIGAPGCGKNHFPETYCRSVGEGRSSV